MTKKKTEAAADEALEFVGCFGGCLLTILAIVVVASAIIGACKLIAWELR